MSLSLDNITENRAVVFIAYSAGRRARDYTGARIYARVNEVLVSGAKFDVIRESIRERYGAEKADELQATVNCNILRVRPIVDRGQRWDNPPFED